MVNGTMMTDMERKALEVHTRDEYSHLDKNQQMAARSARSCLTAQPDSGYVHSWVHMTMRAMKEPNYTGTIMTFSHDVDSYYCDSIVAYAMEYIRKVRPSGAYPGYIDFASGARIRLMCCISPIAILGVHVKEMLVDVRTSLKKPITEILRK